MGKIFYIMGKSASGKDTIYKELMEKMPKFHSIVPYTTRPMREGEKDGQHVQCVRVRRTEWNISLSIRNDLMR